jgi:hypothetical protein
MNGKNKQLGNNHIDVNTRSLLYLNIFHTSLIDDLNH